MTIRVVFIAAALIAGLASANAATKIKPWQKGVLADTVLACPKVRGAMNLIAGGGNPWKAGVQAIEDKCVSVDKGENVLATNESGPFTCFSYKDRPNSCLWTLTEFITPVDR